jgi:hypothetical protein
MFGGAAGPASHAAGVRDKAVLLVGSFRAYQYLEAAVTSRGRPIKFIPKLTELACAELAWREEIATRAGQFAAGSGPAKGAKSSLFL